MPCGGIYPFEGNEDYECIFCGCMDPYPELWVEEWDAALHYKCLGKFLASPMGEIVLAHRHIIFANPDNEK